MALVQIQLPDPNTESIRTSLTESTNEDHSSGSNSTTTSTSNSNSHSHLHSNNRSTYAYDRTLSSLSPPLWTHRVSASFSAMAEQISAASQAIAMIPPLPDSVYSALSTRLEAIERAQEGLEGEFRDLRERMEGWISTINLERDHDSVKAASASANSVTVSEDFDKMLKEQNDLLKLEQNRLPARLHNAIVTVSKASIKPIITANGKPPPNFPTTRGEFEHLTKERYEMLMKAYGIPISGDIVAKRNTLRSFIGLPE